MSQVRLQELNRVTRYETKRVVLCLIARNLAEWVVRGSLAREIEPKLEAAATAVHFTSFRAFAEFYSEQVQLEEPQESRTVPFEPPFRSGGELVGIIFEEPQRRKREQGPCALIQQVCA